MNPFLAAIILAATWMAPAAAQPYSGPPSSSTAYWDEPAFKEHPYKGPATAIGVIFWSHGVDGKNAQWHGVPPPIMRDFARRGWDVVKVQRNNLHENGWVASGPRHVADVLERVKKARGEGYRRVILAGQSYGGAISLEASAQSDDIFGVIAFAPGHGSDACGSRDASAAFRNRSSNLPGYLVNAIAKLRPPRVVLTMAEGDECMGFERPSARLEAALKAIPARYVHFDDTMPIRGHGAAATNQFSAWYRDCLIDFMTPGRESAAHRTICPPPANARYLLPAKIALKPAPAKPASLADLVGLWSGTYASADTYADRDRDICLAIEEAGEGKISATAYYGAGPARNLSMAVLKLQAARAGGGFTHRGVDQFAFALTPKPAEAAIDIAITSRDGNNRWTGRLRPGNCAG